MTKLTTMAFLLGHTSYRGDDCLLWPFGRHSSGYGQVCVGKSKIRKAHRVMCELVHGPAPTPKHHAAHNCGNTACVNPKHIAWKTQSENERDKHLHGTVNRFGPRGKLTREQKQEIIGLAGKVPQPEIARRYRISRSRVSEIVRDKPRRAPKGYQKVGNSYYARIVVNKKYKYLGSYSTPAEATAAFLAAENKARNATD